MREFIEKSFEVVGITIRWLGNGTEEVGVDMAANQVVVRYVGLILFRGAMLIPQDRSEILSTGRG